MIRDGVEKRTRQRIAWKLRGFEDDAQLKRLVLELPPDEMCVVALEFAALKNTREIADMLRMSQSTVIRRRNKALDALADSLGLLPDAPAALDKKTSDIV